MAIVLCRFLARVRTSGRTAAEEEEEKKCEGRKMLRQLENCPVGSMGIDRDDPLNYSDVRSVPPTRRENRNNKKCLPNN